MKALKVVFSKTLVWRSFKVTQGQKLPIKGHKRQISIFIKSSKIRDGKVALTVSFAIELASRSIKVTQGQKLQIKGHKGQFLIIESRFRHSKFSATGLVNL